MTKGNSSSNDMPALSIVVAAPKTISMLLASGDPALRSALEAAMTKATFSSIPAGMGKTTALREARKGWAGRTVWTTARNGMVAAETGRAAGAEPVNALSTAALRALIAKGEGPSAGDVLVVDEFTLLAEEDATMISELADSGVIVEVIGLAKKGGCY